MKKIFLISFVLLGMIVSAQNFTDVMRYSVEDMNGTARYKSMSGAFGALGGDFSAIGINPAGSSVFSGSEIAFSFETAFQKNQNSYQGLLTKNKISDFSLNQFGAVFVFSGSNQNTDWKKVALSFNYQQNKNFDLNNLYFEGAGVKRNLGDYFEYYADGIAQQDLLLEEYQNKRIIGVSTLSQLYQRMGNAGARAFRLRTALLGHYAGLIDPKIGRDRIDPSDSDILADAILNETDYVSNVNGYTQQHIEKNTKGSSRVYNFNFSAQYGENIFFGINLNSHSIDYIEKLYHKETYTNVPIRNAYFENELRTTAGGFSFQLGTIIKASENLRLGATYQSPTWYSLQDEYTQYLSVNNKNTYADPNVIVLSEYKFRTPGSWTASLAYVFDKRAIVSVDYMYKGYADTYFSTDYLKPENDIIQKELGDTNAVRLGAEFRVTSRFSVRGGYRWEQSPYKNTQFIGNLNGYSMGIGYAFNGWKLDVSYDIAKQNNQYQMYESVLTTPVKIASNRSNLLFTLSSKLF